MTHASLKPSPDSSPRSDVANGGASTVSQTPERQTAAYGRVASVVAHELTNLLQILASSLDRLGPSGRASDVSPDEAVLAMQTIRASMDRGTRVARQLQTFAQLAPPRLQPRELHQLMAGWMSDFEEAVGPQMRLELRLRHSGSVLVDAEQLQGALLNLLANAREASAPGALIVLELSRVARVAGMSCRIAVIDHGEGMNEDVAKQAAAPFYTTRPPGKGMGLGLTIARMVTEAHGGTIEIDSAPGRGTTVSLYLPLPGMAHGRFTPASYSVSTASTAAPTTSASPAGAPAPTYENGKTVENGRTAEPARPVENGVRTAGTPATGGVAGATSAASTAPTTQPGAGPAAGAGAAPTTGFAGAPTYAAPPTTLPASAAPGAATSGASTPGTGAAATFAPASTTPASSGVPTAAPAAAAASSGTAPAPSVAPGTAAVPAPPSSPPAAAAGAGTSRQSPPPPSAGVTPGATPPAAAAPPMSSAPAATSAPTPGAGVGSAPAQPAARVAPAPPTTAMPAAPPVSPGHPSIPTPIRPAPRSSGCVLVIDDEEAIAEYFRIILTAERYDVHVVCSAHQAIERFSEDPQRYDAVLLDMMLRDGSGIELYRSFRALRPDLRVVVCTGFSDNESLAPIRADGHDILYKPCPRSEVLKAIARAVSARRAAI
jgi:CheY-like chemotaxis protein/anti-sigma regulatory factor (Ser/Thr protein kinase)